MHGGLEAGRSAYAFLPRRIEEQMDGLPLNHEGHERREEHGDLLVTQHSEKRRREDTLRHPRARQDHQSPPQRRRTRNSITQPPSYRTRTIF